MIIGLNMHLIYNQAHENIKESTGEYPDYFSFSGPFQKKTMYPGVSIPDIAGRTLVLRLPVGFANQEIKNYPNDGKKDHYCQP